MTTTETKTARAMHDLVATCQDAAEGYAKAAKGLHDRSLSDRLTQTSAEREAFASDLGEIVITVGGQARNDLHEGGILHRGWVDLEARIRPKTQHDILQDCLRGDTGTLKHYDHVLQQELPDEARTVVERQRAAVEKDIHFLESKLLRSNAHSA